MGRRSTKEQQIAPKKLAPALTPEAEENQMIALAVKNAKEQMLNGTASAQIICHYLKLASMKERAELKKTEYELELIKAKTEAIKSQQRSDEFYAQVIDAFKSTAYVVDPNDGT